MEENTIINTAGSELLGPDGMKLTIGDTIRKSFKAAVEIKDGERAVIATVSTDAIDRDMEVVMPKGVDLAQFRENPVVLWAHDYKQPPIGRCQWIKLSKDRRRLIAKTEFNHTPLGEMTYNLYRDGYLKAFSIGFLVKAASPPSIKEMEERPELEQCWAIIRESVMLEYSAVPIPSNPEALAIAVSKGMAVPGEIRKTLLSVPTDLSFHDGDLDEPASEEAVVPAVAPEDVEAPAEEKGVEGAESKALSSVSGPDGGYLVDDEKKPKKDDDAEEEAAKPKKEVADEAAPVVDAKKDEKTPEAVETKEADRAPEASPVEEPAPAEAVAVVEEPVAKEVEPDAEKGVVVVEHTPAEEIVTQALSDAAPKAAAEEEKPAEEKAPSKCETCGKPMDECKCGDKAADDEPDEDNKPDGKPDGDADDSKPKKAKPSDEDEPDEDDKPGGEPDGDADDSKSKKKPKPDPEAGDDGDDEEPDDDGDDEKAKPKKGVDEPAKPVQKLIVFRTRKQVELALVKYLESIDFMSIIEKMISEELDRRRGRI